MAGFKTPVFNLKCGIFQAYTGTFPPPPAAKTQSGVPCQLRTHSSAQQLIGDLSSVEFSLIIVPAGTDVRGTHSGAAADVIECPEGTGRYYLVQGVEDRGKGFPNESRSVAVKQLTTTPGGWPYPTP